MRCVTLFELRVIVIVIVIVTVKGTKTPWTLGSVPGVQFALIQGLSVPVGTVPTAHLS